MKSLIRRIITTPTFNLRLSLNCNIHTIRGWLLPPRRFRLVSHLHRRGGVLPKPVVSHGTSEWPGGMVPHHHCPIPRLASNNLHQVKNLGESYFNTFVAHFLTCNSLESEAEATPFMNGVYGGYADQYLNPLTVGPQPGYTGFSKPKTFLSGGVTAEVSATTLIPSDSKHVFCRTALKNKMLTSCEQFGFNHWGDMWGGPSDTFYKVST